MNKKVNTRGNQYKLYQSHSRLDIRKYLFTNRVVAIWNSLPDCGDGWKHGVIKKRLDKFWSNQAMFFNFEAELEGTGSHRSHSNVEFIFDVDIEA